MAMTSNVCVAVDAMGGDFAPGEIVYGSVQAAAAGGVEILLVGDQDVISRELASLDHGDLPITVIPSVGVVMEGESPIQVMRQKPQASIIVASGLVKAKQAQALVSMGSTGATMAASVHLLGLLEGIERPALGGPIIGMAPETVLLDLGSNLDCRPGQLLGFAALGSIFAQFYLGVTEPRVGLLSVGAEAGKGNRQTREAYDLLAGSGLNFIGNVEGYDLPVGRANVVVCDGFVGNVIMKLVEGIGQEMIFRLRSRLEAVCPPKDLEAVTDDIQNMLNGADRSGGGPLFGVNGVAIVGHGRARASTVARAIHTARHCVEIHLVEKFEVELSRLKQKAVL
jgi:glycerol-3-phosphate acyltransferase PlsX